MDNEIKGVGNSLNYKYRMHDPRLGRFFAIDPLASKYPWNSSYAFSENRVIDGVELEGLEYDRRLNAFKIRPGDTYIKISNELKTKHNINISVQRLIELNYYEPTKLPVGRWLGLETFGEAYEAGRIGNKYRVFQENYKKLTGVFREISQFTDADDYLVLTEGKHTTGEKATTGEKILAGVFIVLPISAKSIGKLLKNSEQAVVVAIRSSVKQNAKLMQLAKKTFKGNKKLSKEASSLIEQLAKGNNNPGIGTKFIKGTNGVYEARSRGGARVYFRNIEEGIEIVGYSNKSTQKDVINELKKVYPKK